MLCMYLPGEETRMPSIRLRKVLLDRLLSSAKSLGELGLAMFMTAGVTSCGGTTVALDGGDSDGSTDGAEDHPQFEVAEVAQEAGGRDVTTHDSPEMEAVEVAQEDGGHDVNTADSPVMEAVEAAMDAH
jgi:hypothetical protein